MQMALPIFFIFTVYAVINAQLPLFLTAAGYTVTEVGILLAVFECFGTFCTFLLTPVVERQKNYGLPLLLYSLLTLILPLPIIGIHHFTIAAVALGLYAVGYRGLVPLSDAIVNNVLADKSSDYGKVRAIGSFSFVIMAIILQIFGDVRKETRVQMILWMSVPAFCTCLSCFAVPGLMTGKTGVPREEPGKKRERSSFRSELSGFPAEFWLGIMITFAAFLGTSPISKFFSLYVTDSLHINAAPVLWALSAASEVPFMFFSGRLIRRYGSARLLIPCTACISLRLIVYILFPSFAGALAGQLLNSVTYGIFHPAAIAFVSEHCPPDKRITGLTLYSVLSNGVASIIGSAAGGFIIDNSGYPLLFFSFALFPLAGIAIFYIWRRCHR